MKEKIIRSLQFQWTGCYVGSTITWSCNTWLRYPWGVANFQNDLSEAEIQKRKHQSTGRSVSPRFWCPELRTSFAGSRGSWGHSGWSRVRGRLKYIRPDWSSQGLGSEVNFASISWLMSLDRKWYFIFVFYSHHWIELNQSLEFCHNLKFGNWEHKNSFSQFCHFFIFSFLNRQNQLASLKTFFSIQFTWPFCVRTHGSSSVLVCYGARRRRPVVLSFFGGHQHHH